MKKKKAELNLDDCHICERCKQPVLKVYAVNVEGKEYCRMCVQILFGPLEQFIKIYKD